MQPIPPGSDGLLFLPYLLGERAPIWNADARGAYFGMNIKHEQNILYVPPSKVYYMRFTALEKHYWKTILNASLLMAVLRLSFVAQMIADIFNKP